MIKEVKKLLEFLFKKETQAINAKHYKEKFDEYNSLAAEIKSYMNDITVGLGLPIHRRLKDDEYYEDFKNAPYPMARDLYKISEYNHAAYGKLWACYVSGANPIQNKAKLIFDCFIISKVDEDLKIIADFIPDPDTSKWIFVGGDRSIKYYELGEPVAIERYLEPTEEWSLEEYLKDK
ncbi:hypothetical protein SAMN05421786_101417 [Chryseobacterium ureilyticum]|uniref:Uncharacterized protein n=1 Tax=Chryseobacterium ureilyticum TaxID=373668 RepID=A0A1N7KEI1_9FLAO|nr:hypothetical protein [Chryseobacterium ureilyticum]SIS59993.1 hypothetical protein SAMN05421786_101417 [Chryseobacterium ureilyticum]